MDANYRFGGFGRGGDAAPAPECSKQGAHGERRTRDAEGAEDRGVEGEAVSPPKPIRGSGERRKLPQRDPGQSQLTWAVSPPKIGCYRPHPPRRPICSQLGPLRQPGITSTNGTSPQMSGCRPKESVVRANQSCLLGDPEDVSDYRPNLEATQDVTLYGSASLL